jgi:hypothetical protein
MFFALQLDRGNIVQALSDNMLVDLGLNTNQYNYGMTIFYICFLCRIDITADKQEARSRQLDSYSDGGLEYCCNMPVPHHWRVDILSYSRIAWAYRRWLYSGRHLISQLFLHKQRVAHSIELLLGSLHHDRCSVSLFGLWLI